MTTEIEVLDHGYVRLVDSMGSDLSIVRAARVSHDADWRAGDDEDKDARLIGYLLKNRHSTPFEAVTFTFEIKCPLFIARQWHRSRTWSYNEVSARYTELPEEFYVPDPETLGRQSKTNKQVRDLSAQLEPHELDCAKILCKQIRHSCEKSFAEYRDLLAEGVPRELARSVLPSATYTRFFGTVNLHNLLHFLSLRMDPHAQWEIQQYARGLFDLAHTKVPVALNSWHLLREAKK